MSTTGEPSAWIQRPDVVRVQIFVRVTESGCSVLSSFTATYSPSVGLRRFRISRLDKARVVRGFNGV
jgi:hypothetical protein